MVPALQVSSYRVALRLAPPRVPEAADALVALIALSRGSEAQMADRSARLLLAGKPHSTHAQGDPDAMVYGYVDGYGDGYGYGDGDGAEATERPSSLGNRLRQARAHRGLTQDGLAAASGVSRATIANLERGSQAGCNTATVAKLEAVLGASLMTTLARN